MQGDGDADIENRLVVAVGEGRDGVDGESGIEAYASPYVKEPLLLTPPASSLPDPHFSVHLLHHSSLRQRTEEHSQHNPRGKRKLFSLRDYSAPACAMQLTLALNTTAALNTTGMGH